MRNTELPPQEADALFTEARFGIQVEAFLESEVGRYLIGYAEEEEREALSALASVAPTQPDAIRELQNQVWRARSLRQWLAEAVDAGHSAEFVLRQHED